MSVLNKKKWFVSGLALALAGFSVAVLGAHAQITITPPGITIFAAPASPSPGELITIKAEMPAFDTNSAYFEWFVNGVFRPNLSGPAKHTINLTAGGIGSSISVDVAVLLPDGSRSLASAAIRSADLSLLWFAETYVPRWYKGKTLPVQRSVVRLVAVPDFAPDGLRIPPEELTYVWDFDDETRALAGRGEQIFRIQTNDFLKTGAQVKVTVEDTKRKIRKEKILVISNTTPKVSVYPLLPLGGVDMRSTDLGGFFFRDIIDFIAEPFFFAVTSKKELSFRWDVSGNPTEGAPANPDILTVRSSGPSDTGVVASVAVDDKNFLTPQASKIFYLNPR